MKSLLSWKRLLLLSLLTPPLCVMSARILGEELWWFGCLLSYVLFEYLQLAFYAAYTARRSLGETRFKLNLNAAHIAPRKLWPYQTRLIFVFVGVISGFGLTLKSDFQTALGEIVSILEPEVAYVRIEYPGYANTPPIEKELDRGNSFVVQVDTGSFVQVFVRNKKKSSKWNLIINQPEASAEAKAREEKHDLSESGRWSSSVASLYARFGVPKQPTAFEFQLFENKGTPAKIRVETSPVPIPIVQLDPTALPEGELSPADIGKLYFNVEANSRIPLSLVELAVRTKSGYRFSKTLGEFANASELNFTSQRSELSTMGIPFSEKDILYIKAVAKTVAPDIVGESREIEIHVKSRQEIRQELVKELEEALETLKNAKGTTEEQKNSVQKNLSKAQQLSTQLGRRSPMRKLLDEAQKEIERMQASQDDHSKTAQKKIQTAMESLQREQNKDRLASVFARLQNLKSTIAKASKQELPKLKEDAQNLSKDVQTLKQGLHDAVENSASGLTLEEKQEAQRLLNFDKTDKKLEDIMAQLESGDKNRAESTATQANDEAQQHMGAAMQMLMAARQRAMKEAREKLTEADKKLEDAKNSLAQKQDPKADESLRSAQKDLESTPRLGKEFNEHLNNAKSRTGKAMREGPGQQEQNASAAQDEIVKALSSLQDEEEMEKDGQRDSEEQAYRSSMDVMAAQGQLDVGWRKKILEEISRLRAQGESADSPLLKYLESRLR
jgi:hypothetical protein